VSGLGGTPNGDVATTASNVKFGQSGSFDGNGDYIRVANNQAFTFGAGSSFTLSAWVWPNTTTGVHRIITNDENGFDLRIISNTYNFEFKPSGQPGQNLISSIAPVGGQWNLVTVVKTPTVITMYINGVSGGTLAIADGPLSSTHDLTIGSYTPGTSEFFNGLMDDVAIWNRALSYTEITQLLSQPVLP
jgi:MSHA biogenesis protein MshQ